MDKIPTAGIILAAGMSTRLGRPKQLLELGGSTVLSMVVDAAVKSDLDRIVLVLGHEADAIRTSLDDRLQGSRIITVINSRYREGMSTSLRAGLKEIMCEYPSIMVLMGDQPLMNDEVINLILMMFRASDKDICVPVYQGRRGLPACFTGRFYNDILEISGDMGAREIIGNNPEKILAIEMESQVFLMDVDEKADLERINSLIKGR